MNVNIALVQMNTILGEVSANLEKHLDWIRQAQSSGADLVVFPELSLTGYLLLDITFPVAIHPHSDPVFDALLHASRDVDLMVGFVEADLRSRYFISSAYLSRGKILHIHRKLYLPTYGMFDEKRFFAPGENISAFDTRFGRVGMLICEDFWHLSAPYVLWMDGADLLLFHAASPGHGLNNEGSLGSVTQVRNLLRMYAGLFTTFIAYTNRAGFEDGLFFPGDALVIDPDGSLLQQGEMQEGMVMAEINMQQLARTRSRLPMLRDERPDLVQREIKRILSKDI